jgi:hypothetical protein
MTKTQTLDQLAARLLLDGRDDDLKVLAKASAILCGARCPFCDGRNVITNDPHGRMEDFDGICEDGCNDGESYGIYEQAAEVLATIGVDLV